MELETSVPVPAVELGDARFTPLLARSGLTPQLLRRVPLGLPEGSEVVSILPGVDGVTRMLGRVGAVSGLHGRSRLLMVHPKNYPLAPGAHEVEPYDDWIDAAPLVWGDEFHNPYTVRTLKGTLPEKAELREGVDQFHPWGLMDLSRAGRCIAASHALRGLGIETESIVGISEPQVFIHDGKQMSLKELKASMWSQFRGELDNSAAKDELTVEEYQARLGAAERYLTSARFAVLQRDELTPMRMDDLFELNPEQVAREVRRLCQVVGVLNPDKRQRILGRAKLPKFQRDGRLKNEEAFIEGLLTVTAPRKLGTSLATLHNHGTVFGYIHSGNVSLTGGMRDLETVRGKLLDLDAQDKMVTEADYRNDFLEPFHSDHGHLLLAFHMQASMREGTQGAGDTTRRQSQTFIANYIRAYVENREGMRLSVRDANFVDYCSELMKQVGNDSSRQSNDEYIRKINQAPLQEGMQDRVQQLWDEGVVTAIDLQRGVTPARMHQWVVPAHAEMVAGVEERLRWRLEHDFGQVGRQLFQSERKREAFEAAMLRSLRLPADSIWGGACTELADKLSPPRDRYVQQLRRPGVNEDARLVRGRRIAEFGNVPFAAALNAFDHLEKGKDGILNILLRLVDDTVPIKWDDEEIHGTFRARGTMVTDQGNYCVMHECGGLGVFVHVRPQCLPDVVRWLERSESAQLYRISDRRRVLTRTVDGIMADLQGSQRSAMVWRRA
jgi:hypothetical protein